ncbi:hypothetical protein E1293_22910 [Actinomadura darangshiensis]|uniref:Uncharacterized protein n=1 Tax=Actinomadura darangshiensis TaxID=705336 RepID=A0A4R5B4A2_9ACTN|nr:hypothetical protein [Actinomadura darangshiensis]TDD79599.1 hypothetical protein E1293_22910 [Actinomadura darangshiensis]
MTEGQAEAGSPVPVGWHEIQWPWDLTSSYLTFTYLDDLPRTGARITEALKVLEQALYAIAEPDLRWSAPLEDMLPAGMWTAWTPLLSRLSDHMPRLSAIRADRVREVAVEFAPRAALPPEIARRLAPDLLTAWLGYLAGRMLTHSLKWAEDSLREQRESAQLTPYLELVTNFIPKVDDEKLRYRLTSGLRTTAKESALPYLERLTASSLPTDLRKEAEWQAQLLLNDLVKDSEGGWL